MNYPASKFLACIRLSFLFAVGSAHAAVVTPPGPAGAPIPFTASGPATVSKAGIPIGCTIVFAGTIDGAGKVSVTSAAFSGSALCKVVKANATATSPWTGQVDNPMQLTIDNVLVNVAAPFVGGQCGPSRVTAQIRETDGETTIGLSNVALSGGCAISGALTTTPYLHVTH
ncbi:activator protein [Burkholderia sp. ABCPW 14]|uniref:activator protein n=1 Tax=Burkholderia sp. ABCPW 14 TaxID=1637860 RepID=UPI000ACEAF01|nr:activator protein [Burkholderia sp. ABCPW 14]